MFCKIWGKLWYRSLLYWFTFTFSNKRCHINLRRTSWVENDPERRRLDTYCQPFIFATHFPDFIFNRSFLQHIHILLVLTFRCNIVFPTLKHNTPTLYFVGRFQPILFIWKILRGSFSTHTFCMKNTSWVVFDPYFLNVKN